MNQRSLDAATLRRLAVKADCDPRTVLRVLRGEARVSLSAERARRALDEAGLLERQPTATVQRPASFSAFDKDED